jgi:pyruvate,orthophosphate dikinase
MQDIEFTIEQGRLYLLQTRTGKRTASAAVRIVVDFVEEGVITKREAIERVDPTSLEVVMRPTISPGARRKVVAKGLDASPGAACGRVVFQSSDCQLHFERDEPTVLVRLETSPEDIQGMTIAEGVLTARGGQTSHAAVVARGMGKPCVVGCTEIQVDYAREVFYAGDAVVKKGDWITIDGSTGEVLEGQVEMLAPDADSGDMSTLLGWADEVSALSVRANADTGHDALKSRQLGAVGIGLCRTEHMFFQPDALRVMRRMILADDPRARQLALNEILPMQRTMFQEIFTAMDGYPVTIRLLDPPLHEFLPQREADITEVANDLGVRAQLLRARLEQLHEVNPMLGHRGVRVGITTPEVYQTQVRAIMEAACTMSGEGVVVMPEIMIPLVGMTSELVRVRALVADMAEAVCAEYGMELSYSIGTMIEIPRAVLVAEDLAKHADFFSFGTNDLTQLTYGFSRDDMAKFFTHYQREGILATSPLATFDTEGVGQLVQMGVERGRGASPRLKVGVCGEHGGDPTGVGFFHSLGVDYVSCSPYRVPVARLAAAHASLGLL